jgi:AraC-like DNA-binding protein
MDPLGDVLEVTRVSGAVTAQVAAHEPWGLSFARSPAAAFHAVMAGDCWLGVDGSPPLRLMPGDVVLLPTGAAHTLASAPGAPTREYDRIAKEQKLTPAGDLRLEGSGACTRLLCAAYSYDHEVAHPLLSIVPPVLHLPAGAPGEDGAVAATLRLLAMELEGRSPGSRVAIDRLIDLLFVHVLRGWLREQPDDRASWLRALRDPASASALALLHAQPAKAWTVQALARELNVSRATLARRFHQFVGDSPVAYLTRWRMELAAQQLRDTTDTVGTVAHRVGYSSEYAFSRAFSRVRGVPPGRYRAACLNKGAANRDRGR